MTDSAEALPRLIQIAMRRYGRDPSTRRISAMHAAINAVRLLASETSGGEAALTVAEALAEIAQAERQRAKTREAVER